MRSSATLVAMAALASCRLAFAQLSNLQVTEVMFNPLTASESRFEWIELRNAGPSDIDLDGYAFSDLGDTLSATNPAATPINILATTSGGNAANTVVPAGSVAVLYNGTAFEFDDARYRAGWNLPSDVRLIGVEGFPQLNSSGAQRQVGLWDSAESWELDAPIDGEQRKVTGFANAAYSFDYTVAAGFPASSDGQSIAYSGDGSITDGTNWSLSESGVDGAVTSLATFLPSGDQLNGPDIASPNVVPTGAAASGVLITEFIAQPADSPDEGQNSGFDFEWIEVLNNTGGVLDLTGYVLDDLGSARSYANIAGGSIANGETAVLFDAGNLQISDLETIWGPGNYVPVTGWPQLNNGGDTFGLWNSLASYQSEVDPGMTFNEAVAVLSYQSATGGWPDGSGDGSIYLTNLDAANGNGESADGSLWAATTEDAQGAAIANPLFESPIPDYHAGDVGSPGVFGNVTPSPILGDFNDDGVVNLADYTVWRDNLGSTTPGVLNGVGDNGGASSGIVDAADYLLWKTRFGSVASPSVSLTHGVPEPASAVLFGLMSASALYSKKKLSKITYRFRCSMVNVDSVDG